MIKITRDDLEDMRALVLKVVRDREKYDVMKSRLTSPQGLRTDDKVQSSGGDNQQLLVTAIELGEKIQVEEAQLESMKRVAEEAFAVLEEDDALLLKLRFMCGLEWDDVWDILCCSDATGFRQYKKSMEQLFGKEYT